LVLSSNRSFSPGRNEPDGDFSRKTRRCQGGGGGRVAGTAREKLEQEIGKRVISGVNYLRKSQSPRALKKK
jgi:hypothetical protein